MPVKASDIQKLLPESGKKNCKGCGLATCFAFAMKLANGGITMEKCPYLSPEARAELEEMMLPAIRKVAVGKGSRQVVLGGEEVMHRHQKTFFHAPGIAIQITDTETDTAWEDKIAKLSWQFERLNKVSRIDLVALCATGRDNNRYLKLAEKVMQETEAGLILAAADAALLLEAYEVCQSRDPLVCVTADNFAKVVPHLDKSGALCARASQLADLAKLVNELQAKGFERLVLDPGSRNLPELIRDQTVIRRSALQHKFKVFGCPTVFFATAAAADLSKQLLLAAAAVAKYAGIIILADLPADFFHILSIQRQDIYTDPRVPPTVDCKVYAFNEADQKAAVLVTTNFALTYYAVAGELEKSKQPAYLLCQDTGGLCVLAAWSAGKLIPETIAEMVKKEGMADRVDKKQLIIPGLVARIKGDLEEELPDWEIIVGPWEAADLPGFLQELRKRQEESA
jgi:acetyl-CoA decarbonylase/synthase complex subunit gamma